MWEGSRRYFVQVNTTAKLRSVPIYGYSASRNDMIIIAVRECNRRFCTTIIGSRKANVLMQMRLSVDHKSWLYSDVCNCPLWSWYGKRCLDAFRLLAFASVLFNDFGLGFCRRLFRFCFRDGKWQVWHFRFCRLKTPVVFSYFSFSETKATCHFQQNENPKGRHYANAVSELRWCVMHFRLSINFE